MIKFKPMWAVHLSRINIIEQHSELKLNEDQHLYSGP